MLKHYFVLVLTLPLLYFPVASSVAQPQAKAEEAKAKAKDRSPTRAEDTPAKKKTPANSKTAVTEIFIPSEKISEDLSVSFPIDI